MEQVLEIFANGIFGVFTGMVVLYFTIKLISLLVGEQQDKKK